MLSALTTSQGSTNCEVLPHHCPQPLGRVPCSNGFSTYREYEGNAADVESRIFSPSALPQYTVGLYEQTNVNLPHQEQQLQVPPSPIFSMNPA
mmetsp:Transcript_46753/g.78496  ORF Transcript_46753/g.78496 Transcript_46753/m.78496 type:complete len:93 (+) Transcript_46753:838-1116(+)